MKVYEGNNQEFATLIQSSALLRALIKKGIITEEEVVAEVSNVLKDIKQTLALARMKNN